MGNNELYDLIEKFLKCANMSRRKFAKRAGIPPTTFQHKFEVKSNMRPDIYMSISSTMMDILSEEQNQEKRCILCGVVDDFESAYLNVDYIDPYFKKIIEANRAEIASGNPDDTHQSEEAWNDFLNYNFSQNYTVTERNCINSIHKSLECLNETGIKIAAERVKELTKIPDYQKGNE